MLWIGHWLPARINERTRTTALAALLTGRQCRSATDRLRRAWKRTLLAPLGSEARKRERVRCSSLVDWPVYPRLRALCRRQARAQCGPTRNTGNTVTLALFSNFAAPPTSAAEGAGEAGN